MHNTIAKKKFRAIKPLSSPRPPPRPVREHGEFVESTMFPTTRVFRKRFFRRTSSSAQMTTHLMTATDDWMLSPRAPAAARYGHEVFGGRACSIGRVIFRTTCRRGRAENRNERDADATTVGRRTRHDRSRPEPFRAVTRRPQTLTGVTGGGGQFDSRPVASSDRVFVNEPRPPSRD